MEKTAMDTPVGFQFLRQLKATLIHPFFQFPWSLHKKLQNKREEKEQKEG